VRGFRSTLILLFVLAGLGAYIYFVDSRKPVGDAAKEKVFASVTADDLEDIDITAEGGNRSRLRKIDGEWRIVEPVSTEADEGELLSITSALPDLEIQRVVEEKPSDLKRYGLEPPRIEVSFRGEGDKEPRRLLIGDRTATGSELYARTPDNPRVFLLPATTDSTFNKNAFALRDKSVLKFERDKVTGLTLTSKAGTIELAKSGTEWRIVKPIAARADFGAVEGVVERLNSLRMQGIASLEGTNELAKYGLTRPSATATVSSGSSQATLLLGSTENAVIHAKDQSRPMIFTVAPTVETDVFKPLEDLRRRDVFDARSFTANRIELRRGDRTVTLEKSKGKDEKEVWTLSGKEVDQAKVDDLLSRLLGLRAESFASAAPASLKSPELTVDVRYDEGKTESVRFARAGTDVVAGRTDEPGAARVMATSYDDAIKALDALLP
jgi:hypothetical protein